MEIKELNILLQKNFNKFAKDTEHLFEVDLDKDELWDLYLDSFPEGTNEVFRERRSYDCSSCRHSVKNWGNIVFIKGNEIKTVWGFNSGDSKFQPVLDALDSFVKSKVVSNVFITKLNKIGTDTNLEKLENGKVLEWDHLYLEFPKQLVSQSHSSEAEIKGSLRDTRNVFKRSLTELTQDSVLTVLELIKQNSLYRGEQWKTPLYEFLKLKKEYDKLQSEVEKSNYAWEQSVVIGGSIGRIRNDSIGTLLVDLSKGEDLDTAVRKYEKIVAPENYKRPKAIFTKKMLEDAKNKIEELGYMDSLKRRYATLDDITVRNILFSNKDAAKRIGGEDVFGEMLGEMSIDPKKFTKVEEISIDNFIKNVLPTAKELEVFLENKHSSNMVSLIAPEDKDSKTMFKWDNNFGWAYSGNITDSTMKQNVKSAGGKVDGVLRFSIQWNEDEYDGNDLDAHCYEPNGYHIYFGQETNDTTGGQLDVDVRRPVKNKPAVENITWSAKDKMRKGVYKFFVKNYSHRGGRKGFRSEIEFDGEIHNFEYNKELKADEIVQVAEVTFDGNNFTIKTMIPSTVSTKEVWNLKTNQFVPVSVAMFSPNYWDEQQGNGHKHYFFMLKDCINPENPNGFYNEFLKEDLMQHKRVFEALGGKMAVKEVDDQLSGLGFSSTKRNELLIKVTGQTERVLRVKI